MRALKASAWTLSALAAAVLLAGCADPSSSAESGSESPVSSIGASAPATTPTLAGLTRSAPCTPPRHVVRADRRHILAFHPVAAVKCKYEERRYPNDGEWTVLVRQATRTGVADLVTALDKPDVKPPKNLICASVYIAPPPVVLIDAGGHHLFPRFPLNECRQPQLQARDQVDSMKWQTISVRRDRQQSTPAELASHCAPKWKNELYYDAQFKASRSDGGPVFTAHPHATLHACLYRTSATAIDVGKFVGSRKLDAAQSSRMRAALSLAAPSRSCPAQRNFAVVDTSSADTDNVELGGCWRVHRDRGGGIGDADGTAIRDLLSLK